MKASTLCVDALALQSAGLSMCDGARERAAVPGELPILADQLGTTTKPVPAPAALDDGASEAATKRPDDDDDDEGGDDRDNNNNNKDARDTAASCASPAKPAEPSAAAAALGFVERMVREYTMKREIHALIGKKQQQLRHMQALMAAYQDQLARARAALDEQTLQHATAQESSERESTRRLAEVLATGGERARVEATRCVGLLQRQRHRLLRARTRLRKTVVETRQEECAWLLKSIVAQHDRECEALLEAISARKFLEEGSLQATLAVQIAQDDPIFAAVETLYDAQPRARQLQLQLHSVDDVLAAMRRKCEDLELKHVVASGPVPLVKRPSFRDHRKDAVFPTSERKRVVRLCILEGKRIRADHTTCADLADRHRRYRSVLHSLARTLSDARTRSGRLLHQFVAKLHDDTMIRVRIITATRSPNGDADGSNQSDDDGSAHDHTAGLSDLTQERYVMPWLASLLQGQLTVDAVGGLSVLAEGSAVDTLKMPPPAMIAAFAKFLARVVTIEYELQAPPPLSVDKEADESTNETAEAASLSSDAMGQTVLHDCVHEMVFQRITAITYASAVDEFNFARQDDTDSGSYRFLFPWHWHHSKNALQGISPTELAFPEDTMTAVTAYLLCHEKDVSQHGFLPKTLALFRIAECETTPKGVVRAVMAGFKMLHREIVRVLSPDSSSSGGGGGAGGASHQPAGPARRRPQRRGSSFLNADILIPSIVLMMSRLPHARLLDHLWHRVLLVEAFRASALSDGGEEAYYLTCLAAAIEFINTFQPSSGAAASNPESAPTCSTCDRLRSQLARSVVRIEAIDAQAGADPPAASTPASSASSAAAAASSSPARPRLSRTSQAVVAWSKKEHESIKQLSKWISDQPPAAENAATADIERLVAPHELWRAAAMLDVD